MPFKFNNMRYIIINTSDNHKKAKLLISFNE